MSADTQTTQSPLSIAIIGAGKIGSTFAFQLARTGHDVTVIARPGSSRLAQLTQIGAIVTNTDDRASVVVADALNEAKPYDLVIVTTLAHHVDAVVPALQRSKAQSIHFMFNIFNPERLRTIFEERATFGVPMVLASIGPDGKLRSTIPPNRKTLHGDQRWVDLFNASGLPSKFDADMTNWLRCHVPVCVGMEAISVAGKRRGRGASWSEAMAVARGLKAVFEVIKAQNFPIYPRQKAMMAKSPSFAIASMLWSVSRVAPVRNALANGIDECRSLIDEVLKAGQQHAGFLRGAVLSDIVAMKPRID